MDNSHRREEPQLQKRGRARVSGRTSSEFCPDPGTEPESTPPSGGIGEYGIPPAASTRECTLGFAATHRLLILLSACVPNISSALRFAYGALALKISNSGSPVIAIPSRSPRPRVTNAKNGGTLNGWRKNTSLSSFEISISFRFLLRRFDPDSNSPSLRIFVSRGCSSFVSKSRGRNPSSLASCFTSVSKSPVIKCTIAAVIAFRDCSSTSATRPKSSKHNLPCATYRFPGCGSLWKAPMSRSCERKRSTPTGMSCLMVDLGAEASFTPSTHSLVMTRREENFWKTLGTKTLHLRFANSLLKRIWF
eukprot:Hpha_TRINITY_DN4355_c0_g1::TRINITY_DN4355_c0_g1_i1::g.50151::m.50151